MSVFSETMRQWGGNISEWLKYNCANIGTVIFVLLPFFALWLGSYSNAVRGGVIAIGGEFLLVAVIVALAGILRGVGVRLKMAGDIPVPLERFTEVSDDGQVTVPYERLQELLLYTADLEDYLDRYGYFEVQDEFTDDGANYGRQ